MMKRVWFMMILVCLLLAGCGMEVTDDFTIKQDLLAEGVLPLGQDAPVTFLQVLQRQTNKDDKTDRVFVEVECRAELVEYICRYELIYEYFDQGGWVLQDIRPWQQEDWSIDHPRTKQLEEDVHYPIGWDPPAIEVTTVELVSAVASEDLTECTVYATVQGRSEYADATFPVELTYTLTPIGWKFQYGWVDYENAEVTPFAGIPEEYALADAQLFFGIAGNYAVTGHRDDFAWGSQVWYLQIREPGEYLDVIYDVQMAYYFDAVQQCWLPEGTEVLGTGFQWNIAGSWRSTGTANGVYGDYDYDLTMDITDLGGGQFRVDYDFRGCYGPEGQPDGSRVIPDYSGTIYADTAQTEYRDENLWYGGTPENQFVIELDPHDFFGKLFVCSENGIYLYRSGAGSRYFTRQ